VKQRLQFLNRWLAHRITLRWRLALWTAVLLAIVSLILVIFVNAVAQATIPRAVVIPLLATPPPHSNEIEHSTQIPFDVPIIGSDTVVKGITVQQVQRATLRQVFFISIIGMLLAIGIGSVGVYWLTDHALRPVRNLAEHTCVIGTKTLDKRIALEGPQDDIKALADAFDDMLARLERAFEQQDCFVGDAAHELRTPLATLRANLDVIETDPTATLDDYREMSAALGQVLTRLEHLVTDLLLLARNEKRLVRGELTLGPLLEEILTELRSLADEHQVQLYLRGDPEISVCGDERLLIIAFSNLIKNGILYNRPGGEVVVELCQEALWAMISVTDTGIGISEADRPHIFERFYRAEHSRARHSGGAGLGLSIVAHIVELHSGQVRVESIPGVGSTFSVQLPRDCPRA